MRFRDAGLPGAAESAEIRAIRALAPARAMVMRSDTRTVSELLQEYAGRADVVYAEPNYIWRKEELTNDVFFDAQWALRNTGQTISLNAGTAGADIKATQAWDIAQGSRSVVIGVVDSGIDYNHPDLAANIWTAPFDFTVVVGGQAITCAKGTHGFNAITKTCDPLDDEPDGHGTHVAGIIGADGDNGLGVSGVSRVASMMALKFLDSNGSGTTANAIAAIEFAIRAKAVLGADANIRVLNNSWGSYTFSQALLDTINSAAASNILFVSGAGNDNFNTDIVPHYPSGYVASNIISVAATDNRDNKEFFSNFGPTSVDLGAPGTQIASTLPGMTYNFESGTSMSSAVVSGAAGLVLSGCGGLNTAQLKANLLGSVDPVASMQTITVSGGRLNVYKALQNCAGTPAVFTLKASSALLLPDAAGASTTTITVNPLNGFSSGVTLTASAPAGLTANLAASLVSTGSYSTTLTVTADSSAVPGTYVIHVTGTSGVTTRTTGMVFVIGSPITPGQNLTGAWSIKSSQPDRFRGPGLRPGLADWYRFVLNSTATVSISLCCGSPNVNHLRLLDSFGAVVDAVTAGTLQFSHVLPPGAYTIVVSTRQTFDPISYAVAVNAPSLLSVTPTSGTQGASLVVELKGLSFAPGLTVSAGADIIVSGVFFSSAQSASATFGISSTASLGTRNVSVTSDGATSNTVKFTVGQPNPVITGINPSSGLVGTSVDISIIGDHFIDPTVEIATAGATATLDNVVVVSPTLITGQLTIPLNSISGNLTIRVRTAASSTSASFQIIPLEPTLASITPSSGSLGTIVDVAMTGTNLVGPLTISAGEGITVTNVGVDASRINAAARFRIAPTAELGTRSVTASTPGGESNAVLFTVTPGPPPTLTSISPSDGPQTTTVVVSFRGTNFVTGFTFNGGPDITVTSTRIFSATEASATIEIGGSAALGPREVTVSTVGGISNPLAFTVLPPPPTLVSISPPSGVQESSFNVILTGTDFVSGMTVKDVSVFSSPVSISDVTVLDSTTATATMTIPKSTLAAVHYIQVTTPSGSGFTSFTVLPGTPSLLSIRPTYGIRGRDVTVRLTGSNFGGDTTISPIPGVTVSGISVGSETITAFFSVDASAPLGPHSISITTPGGTTESLTFSLFDPFPDLSVSTGQPEPFWAGLNGTYGITVENKGTLATNSAIVTDLLPSGLTFVSGGISGFSCSANGQLVTCTYSGVPMTPLTSIGFPIIVAVAADAPSSLTHTVSVTLAEDLAPVDNTVTRTFNIQQVIPPVFQFVSTTLSAGQQGSVGLTLPVALPQDVTGTLTLTFIGEPPTFGFDPAVQFATGGREVSFLIPANTTQARFAGASAPSYIGFQVGTIQGSFIFSGSIHVGTAEKVFASGPGGTPLTLTGTAPKLESVRRDTQNGFAILITSFSTSLSVTSLDLQFNTPLVSVSCGSVPGCSASGSTLSFDVRVLFDNWFAGTTQYGSLSTLRLPLIFQGTVRGSVAITLRNALGISNSMSVTVP